jgi:hypothetical protein
LCRIPGQARRPYSRAAVPVGTRSLTRRYPKVTALDGLTVDVEASIVGLIDAIGPAASVRTVRAYLRSFLATAATAALAAPLLAPTRAGAATALTLARPIPLLLPEPTGRFPVGVLRLHLRDLSRPDPPGARDPVPRLHGEHLIPGAPGTRAATRRLASAGGLAHVPGAQGIAARRARGTRTHGRIGARVRHAAAPDPVVIFSPGFGLDRDSATVLVEDLVSAGGAWFS